MRNVRESGPGVSAKQGRIRDLSPTKGQPVSTKKTDPSKTLVDHGSEQDFGDTPESVRESDHYRSEYVDGFVDKWDELIDWKARSESEGSFFADLLRERGKSAVLDVSTGTGFHSIRLKQAGFEVTSADGSTKMLAKAVENAKKHGVELNTVHTDWRALTQNVEGRFDAVLCLGNSFTHLFEHEDRRLALAEFYAALKPDGLLILDQRNYDAMLDQGFHSKHQYYYCGDDVTAEPEHVDTSLARFKYDFPDGSRYHLNMFPLRKRYVQQLLTDTGFQRTQTFGDFQASYTEDSTDFFIHVAERDPMATPTPPDSSVEKIAEDYYDSHDADTFYAIIWGGEDIHIGLYNTPDEDIPTASRRTVKRMAELLGDVLKPGAQILDIGSGYGGPARHLAAEHGATVTCLNLSNVENARNRTLTKEAGLEGLITVKHGSFEQIPEDDARFDAVWSQDAILHSGNREQVLAEVSRVLKPGGLFLFTDPMQADVIEDLDALAPIYERIHLSSLASFAFYRRELGALGFEEVAVEPMLGQLKTHYTRVRAELMARQEELSGQISEVYMTRMVAGLEHWIEGAEKGVLAWGILCFRKGK